MENIETVKAGVVIMRGLDLFLIVFAVVLAIAATIGLIVWIGERIA